MQTFIVDRDLNKSAVYLDNKRLGKQRIETFAILRALQNDWSYSVGKPYLKSRDKYPNQKIPLAIMWKPYIPFLLTYHNSILNEWNKRGFKNSMEYAPDDIIGNVEIPIWLMGNSGNTWLLYNQSNLIRKNPKHYLQFNWNVLEIPRYDWNLFTYFSLTDKQEKINRLNELHDFAMEIADNGDSEKHKCDFDLMRQHYWRAFLIENFVANEINIEPSKTIISKSANTLLKLSQVKLSR